MTGLDKILSKIAQQSQIKCDEIDNQAKREAQALWEDAVQKATNEAQSIVDEAQAKADAIIKSAKNAADSAYKKECLKAKNDIINDVIAASYEKLITLPDKDYFDVILSLCISNAQNGCGIMHLCKADLKRMPKNFEQTLSQMLEDSKSIKISGIAADIPNGFILSYGDVEINCTFHAIFDGLHDELKDAVCPILFS
ncbi:MAG: V-type ATP synthase subunit E [Clostridia bacterium]|nr:V-type ATP synthase subunit E [Clostridia bacterium]